jgi:hypothetical protein
VIAERARLSAAEEEKTEDDSTEKSADATALTKEDVRLMIQEVLAPLAEAFSKKGEEDQSAEKDTELLEIKDVIKSLSEKVDELASGKSWGRFSDGGAKGGEAKKETKPEAPTAYDHADAAGIGGVLRSFFPEKNGAGASMYEGGKQ